MLIPIVILLGTFISVNAHQLSEITPSTVVNSRSASAHNIGTSPRPEETPTANNVELPAVLTKELGRMTIRIPAQCSSGFPLLTITTEGLEHQNEVKINFNGNKLNIDSRWNAAQGSRKTASMVLNPEIVKQNNVIEFIYGESSRDTTKSVTIHAIATECTYDLPKSIGLFIEGESGPVSLAKAESWNPRNISQITNPNAKDHPEFTKLLQRNDLHWADSLRPLTDDSAAHNHYYGARRNSGSGGAANNPRMSYQKEIQASRLQFVKGELGQSGTYQTRIKFPELSPTNAEMASVQWQFRMPTSDIRGGKQFQIADGLDSLHFEYNAYYKTGKSGVRGAWATVPVVRTYSTAKVGGSGFEERLSADRPAGCVGINRCASQPALPFGEPKSAGRKSNYTLSDHVSLGGTAYLTGDEFLSGWITVTVTFDWRDPQAHKVWMWLSDERTEPTLVIGQDTDGDGWGDDGFPLTYVSGRQGIGSFWLEFNNSSSKNTTPSYVDVRNIVIIKGPILPLKARP